MYVAPRTSRAHAKPFTWSTLRKIGMCKVTGGYEPHTTTVSGISWLYDSHSYRIKGIIPCKWKKISSPRHFHTWSIIPPNLFPRSAPTRPTKKAKGGHLRETQVGVPRSAEALARLVMRNPYNRNWDFRLRSFPILAEGLDVVTLRICAASCNMYFGGGRGGGEWQYYSLPTV